MGPCSFHNAVAIFVVGGDFVVISIELVLKLSCKYNCDFVFSEEPPCISTFDSERHAQHLQHLRRGNPVGMYQTIKCASQASRELLLSSNFGI